MYSMSIGIQGRFQGEFRKKGPAAGQGVPHHRTLLPVDPQFNSDSLKKPFKRLEIQFES